MDKGGFATDGALVSQTKVDELMMMQAKVATAQLSDRRACMGKLWLLWPEEAGLSACDCQDVGKALLKLPESRDGASATTQKRRREMHPIEFEVFTGVRDRIVVETVMLWAWILTDNDGYWRKSRIMGMRVWSAWWGGVCPVPFRNVPRFSTDHFSPPFRFNINNFLSTDLGTGIFYIVSIPEGHPDDV